MGEVRDYDRFVSLRLVEDETTAKVGEDYEGIELNPCIKANERQVEVPCRIIRTDKLAIENLVVCLVLQLQENADFSLPLVWWKPFGNMYGDPKDSVNVVRHVIAIDNEVKRPGYWRTIIGERGRSKSFPLCVICFKWPGMILQP